MLDKVKVGAITYDVTVKDNLESYDGNRNLWGYCNYEQSQIDIISSVSVQKKKQIFTHELTHAILHEAGFEDQTEDQANRIGLILNQVLQDNDFSWMREDEVTHTIVAGGKKYKVNEHGELEDVD